MRVNKKQILKKQIKTKKKRQWQLIFELKIIRIIKINKDKQNKPKK